MNHCLAAFCTISALLFSGTGYCEIKKCVGKDGVIHYATDCSSGQKQKDMKGTVSTLHGFGQSQQQYIQNQQAKEKEAAIAAFKEGAEPATFDDCARRIKRVELSPVRRADSITSCQKGARSGVTKGSANKCVAMLNKQKLSPARLADAIVKCHGGPSIFEEEDGYSSTPSERGSTRNTGPSVITSCDSGGCWDNQGGRYNKGGGGTYFGPQGGACQQVGGVMHCP